MHVETSLGTHAHSSYVVSLWRNLMKAAAGFLRAVDWFRPIFMK
jgi:hypothetical protein